MSFSYLGQQDYYSRKNDFMNNMSIQRCFSDVADTFYTVINVNKQKIDGTYQYPFVREIGSTQSAHYLACHEGWFLTINAGLFDGLTIENSHLIRDNEHSQHVGSIPLTIDSNGDLGYYENYAGKGQQIIASGVVSAACGFFPLVVNYNNYNYPTDIPGTFDNTNWVKCQRQVIGQYENGDYCIITAEGRNFANSPGFTIPQLQDLCKSLGLKFAYNCDGGGSTQTIIGEKFLNHVYEGPPYGIGRALDTCIVFNGKTDFEIPYFD